MIIKKWVTMEHEEEIDISISAEDIGDLYLEDGMETNHQICRAISRAWKLISTVDLSMVEEKQREAISNALLIESKRYSLSEDE